MSEPVTIESLPPDCFPVVAEWLSIPATNRWLTAEWRGRTVTPTLLAMVVRNSRNRLFLVRYQTKPCGMVALADLDLADRTAMVWYILGSENLAGRGITSQALIQLTQVGFQQMELSSLYAWTMDDNVASRGVLRKAGFREVGRIRAAAVSAGRQVDRIYFDRVKSNPQSV